jgi:hypothetical protein
LPDTPQTRSSSNYGDMADEIARGMVVDFFMPGEVILWLEYMFPGRVASAFRSARRRYVPLLQIA